MRKDYKKPTIEFDFYEMNEAIAAGCQTIISLGPYPIDDHQICGEYEQPLSLFSRGTTGADNWADRTSCSCYYSSGDIPMLTS